MDCLDANAVQDLMSDRLQAPARLAVMQHLDGCADCRELVGVLAKDTVRSSPPAGALDATAPAIGLEATAAADGALAQTADGSDRFRRVSGIAVGRQLGRYTLVERLGAGAMGVVFRADDRELSRHVAVKVLRRPDPALTDRLRREARSMAQVNHPHVVAVYDVGVADDGSTYIAMELVPGTSLRAWQQRPRTIAETIAAYVAAGRGLAAAHAAGIVHRDFKPDNVLVGDDGRVRVTDFGLAAARVGEGGDTPSGDLSLTRSGTVLGTPAYMAPEQFEGGHVDARTDQFSFCVALYEALYGERPFDGKTFEELADNVIAGRVRPAPATSRVSRALRAIVVRGLAVKPGDRYPTMDHLLDELARDRARPWRRAALVSAMLAVVLAVGFAADWRIRERLRDETTEAFRATGAVADRTLAMMIKLNDAASSTAYLFEAMNQVDSYREDSEFGLGDASEDRQQLQELHQSLASASWTRYPISPEAKPSTIAIGDYRGRLLYTTAAPTQLPMTDLTQLPWIGEVLQQDRASTLRIVPYDDPRLVATGVLGGAPRSPGLAIVFTATGRSGNSLFLQILDAGDVRSAIKLDDTLLSAIVTPEGRAHGDVPADLVTRVPGDGKIHELELGDATYLVLAQPILDPEKQPVGRFVMASSIEGVLLLSRARIAFALAMAAAATIAIAMALRARALRA